MITFSVIDLDDPGLATCGARSPGGRMRCEYPPDHRIGEAGVAGHHFGRDRCGRWRSWAMQDTPEQPVQVCSSITTKAGHSHLICTLPIDHPGMHKNRGTTWTNDEGESA